MIIKVDLPKNDQQKDDHQKKLSISEGKTGVSNLIGSFQTL
jgi:hypothetical protein